MKFKFEVEIDIPNGEAFSQAELYQLVFDDYFNYATVQHLTDAVRWCAKAKVGSPEEDPRMRLIYEHHKLWGDICHNVEYRLIPTKDISRNP